jgi:RNA polymerase sigma-70 factor (ECF subfamily)
VSQEDFQSDDFSDTRSVNDEFLGLFIAHQREIFAFILMLVPNAADAEDLLQETATIMWRKFEQFEKGSNFTRWGIAIARNRIMKFWERQRSSWLKFNSDLTDKIMPQTEDAFGQMEDRIQALQQCLGKLNQRDRELIKLRYDKKTTTRNLAEELGRSVYGLYKTLARIHHVLEKCVQKTLVAWEMK